MDFLKNIDFGELFGKLKDLLGKVDWGDLLKKIKPVLSKVGDFLKKTPSMFMALVLFLTVAVDPAAGNTDTSLLVHEDILTLLDASYAGQGLTNDGKYYYTSGAISFAKYTALAKYEIDTMKRVKKKVFPVDWDLIKKGYDHIGGISYYDGKLYAGMESTDNKALPCIAVFNADSLEYETSFELPRTWFPDGSVAWVAVNPQTGLLYCCAWDHAQTLHEFKIDATMAHVREIDITGLSELDRIQGGEFYQGVLYLSADRKDSKIKEVLAVDVETGAAKVAFTRDCGKADSEAEDITVFQAKDGSLFHVADYNKLLSVYIRSYIAL